MMNWLYKHRYFIFLATVGVFILGAFAGFGAYLFTKSPEDPALEINGTKISNRRWERFYQQMLNQLRNQGMEIDEATMNNMEQQLLQDLVRDEVFTQEGKRYGLKVTDAEVSSYINQIPVFQKDGRFDQTKYFRALAVVFRMLPEDFEEDRRREILARKLQMFLASGVKLTKTELNWELERKLAEIKDPKEREKLSGNTQEFMETLRKDQVNWVINEWLRQVNTKLQVKVYLEKWRKGAQPQNQPTQSGQPAQPS